MFSFILWTVLLPIAITAAMQLAIVRVGPRCGQGDYASALAISLTFLLGLCWLDRWEFPPTRHWHWTGYAGVASAGWRWRAAVWASGGFALVVFL